MEHKRPFWPWLVPIVSVVYTVWVVLLALDKTFGFAKAYEYFGFDTWLYVGSGLFIAFIVMMVLFMPEGKKFDGEKDEKDEEKKPVTVEAMEPVSEEGELPAAESGISFAEGAGVEDLGTEMPESEVSAAGGTGVEDVRTEISGEDVEPAVKGVDIEAMETVEPLSEESEITADQEPIPENYNIIPYPKEVSGAIYSDTFISLDEKNVLNMRTFIGRSCLLCDKQDECWEKYKNIISHGEFLSNAECLKVKKHGENAC